MKTIELKNLPKEINASMKRANALGIRPKVNQQALADKTGLKLSYLRTVLGRKLRPERVSPENYQKLEEGLAWINKRLMRNRSEKEFYCDHYVLTDQLQGKAVRINHGSSICRIGIVQSVELIPPGTAKHERLDYSEYQCVIVFSDCTTTTVNVLSKNLEFLT
jgi:hypothetical protein